VLKCVQRAGCGCGEPCSARYLAIPNACAAASGLNKHLGTIPFLLEGCQHMAVSRIPHLSSTDSMSMLPPPDISLNANDILTPPCPLSTLERAEGSLELEAVYSPPPILLCSLVPAASVVLWGSGGSSPIASEMACCAILSASTSWPMAKRLLLALATFRASRLALTESTRRSAGSRSSNPLLET
jgi:hypothetical protein